MPLDADYAAATQNLLLAAESIGLGSCWIFFVQLAFNSSQRSELREALKIPEGYNRTLQQCLSIYKVEIVNVPDRKPNLITGYMHQVVRS